MIILKFCNSSFIFDFWALFSFIVLKIGCKLGRIDSPFSSFNFSYNVSEHFCFLLNRLKFRHGLMDLRIVSMWESVLGLALH